MPTLLSSFQVRVCVGYWDNVGGILGGGIISSFLAERLKRQYLAEGGVRCLVLPTLGRF